MNEEFCTKNLSFVRFFHTKFFIYMCEEFCTKFILSIVKFLFEINTNFLLSWNLTNIFYHSKKISSFKFFKFCINFVHFCWFWMLELLAYFLLIKSYKCSFCFFFFGFVDTFLVILDTQRSIVKFLYKTDTNYWLFSNPVNIFCHSKKTNSFFKFFKFQTKFLLLIIKFLHEIDINYILSANLTDFFCYFKKT